MPYILTFFFLFQSPLHSDENHPSADSLLYDETVSMDISPSVDTSENLFEPPCKKLKGSSDPVSPHSSESLGNYCTSYISST